MPTKRRPEAPSSFIRRSLLDAGLTLGQYQTTFLGDRNLRTRIMIHAHLIHLPSNWYCTS